MQYLAAKFVKSSLQAISTTHTQVLWMNLLNKYAIAAFRKG